MSLFRRCTFIQWMAGCTLLPLLQCGIAVGHVLVSSTQRADAIECHSYARWLRQPAMARLIHGDNKTASDVPVALSGPVELPNRVVVYELSGGAALVHRQVIAGDSDPKMCNTLAVPLPSTVLSSESSSDSDALSDLSNEGGDADVSAASRRMLPLMDRGLCPWYWRVDYDGLRVPPMLAVAECRCERALLPSISGTLSGRHRRRHAAARHLVRVPCEKVLVKLRVMRRQIGDDSLVPAVMNLPVACAPATSPAILLDEMEPLKMHDTNLPNVQPEW